MKTIKIHISLFSTLIMYSATLLAQKKDSLFFAIDKYYTISPTITPNLHIQTYPERIEAQKKQILETKTNGYVSFFGNGALIKGLKPKKILSIKDYIENRKFYHDGKYNQIVDKWKLKDSLTDKYEVFFVNGEEFIQPRYLEYISYYPIRDKNNIIRQAIKDTLFFSLDNDYIVQSKHNKDVFLFKDGKDIHQGSVYFERIKPIQKIKPHNEVLDLKKFIYASKFYNNSKQMINDFDMIDYLTNYTLILVDKREEEVEYIEVSTVYVIE
jgi:hypothetical protein